MTAFWVTVTLTDESMSVTSNVGTNDRIALLEAGKFQVLAEASHVMRSSLPVGRPPGVNAPSVQRAPLEVRKL